MGIDRIPRLTEGISANGFPCFHKTKISESCQMAASKSWDLFHIDLKTAFLQGQSYGVNRDVVCQVPPETGLLLTLL